MCFEQRNHRRVAKGDGVNVGRGAGQRFRAAPATSRRRRSAAGSEPDARADAELLGHAGQLGAAGYEVDAIHRAGFHPTAVIGALGAAAAVGAVLRLSPPQLTSALGIAGSMASGIIEYLAEGTWTKRLHAGWAAQAGLRAALVNMQEAQAVTDRQRAVDNASHAVERLTRLLTDLRKLSDLGERPIELWQVDVPDLLQDVVDAAHSLPA